MSVSPQRSTRAAAEATIVEGKDAGLPLPVGATYRADAIIEELEKWPLPLPPASKWSGHGLPQPPNAKK